MSGTRIYIPFREDQFCVCCDQVLEKGCVLKVMANSCSYALKGIRFGQPIARSGKISDIIECIVSDVENWSEICIGSGNTEESTIPEIPVHEDILCYLCKGVQLAQYFEIKGKFFCGPCADFIEQKLLEKQQNEPPELTCLHCNVILTSKYVKISNGKLFCLTCTKLVANRLKEKGIEFEGELLDVDNVDFREAFLIKGGKTRSSDKKQSDTSKTPPISNAPLNSSGSPPTSPISSPRGWTRIPLKEREKIPRHVSGSSLIESQPNLVLGHRQSLPLLSVSSDIKVVSPESQPLPKRNSNGKIENNISNNNNNNNNSLTISGEEKRERKVGTSGFGLNVRAKSIKYPGLISPKEEKEREKAKEKEREKADSIRRKPDKKNKDRRSEGNPHNNVEKNDTSIQEKNDIIKAKIAAISEDDFNKKQFQYPVIKLDFNVHKELRDKNIYEIYSTERTYLRNMSILYYIWSPVILDNSILFGNAPDNRKAKINLESLFKIIWEIIETSSSFVVNLNKKLSAWNSNQTIGDCLLAIMWPLLKTYTKFPLVFDCLMEYFQKNTDTKKEINQIKATLIERIALLSEHPCSGGQSFQSLLIQPVQRITRYVLLLGDLIGNTPTIHPEYTQLAEVLSEMRIIASEVNEGNRVSFEKMTQIQQHFGIETEIFLPHRNFVLEGDAVIYMNNVKNKVRVFLFSDTLVIGKKNNVNSMIKFFVTCQLHLISSQVENVQKGDKDLSTEDSVDYAVKFLYKCGSEFANIILFFKNQQEKDSWMSTIRSTTKSYMQKKIIFAKYQGREPSDSIYMNPPTYIYPKKSDPALELCIVCGWNFNVGGSNTKQICKGCGCHVCKDCNRNKIVSTNGSKINVCTTCYFKDQEIIYRTLTRQRTT